MRELFGNTTGLSPSSHKLLERLYRRKVPLEQVASAELIRTLVDASRETGRQVGVLVHRSGQVDYVVVGDATRLMLPDIGRLRAAEGRFRGLRLVHTHLHGEGLSRDDLVDLVRLRLDLIAALQLGHDGEPRGLSYAYNVPAGGGEPPYREVGPVPLGKLDVDFGALIANLEAEFARRARTREVRAKDGRALLVHVAEKNRPGALALAEESLRELRELARTAGVEAADAVLQARDRVDPKFVLGRGKLNDVLLRAAELDAETLIFDHNLSPSQASAIARHTDLKVIDRTQLILDIFAQRAEGGDGKLQVELAQLKYSLPRLAMKDDSLSRLTGGIGGRGPGETKLEIGRRRAKERVAHLEARLRQLGRQREQRRRRRGRLEVPVVAIVGYTNAGKSTLLNALTGAAVLAEDKLFATLDTRSRRLRFPEEREVVLTDTVGFIRDLPEDLFSAFRATFEEAADADLLLHVVDASDPSRGEHIRTTETLLTELDLAALPRLLVYNKADLLAPGEGERLLAGRADAVLVSALHRETARALLDKIAAHLADRWREAELAPPADRVATAGPELERDDDAPDHRSTLDELRGPRRRGAPRGQAAAPLGTAARTDGGAVRLPAPSLECGRVCRVRSPTMSGVTQLRALGWLAFGLAMMGCEGGEDVAPAAAPLCGAEVSPGPAPARRLTRWEYNNTVRDLLGDATRPADAFPADEEAYGFSNNAVALTTSPTLVQSYMLAAEGLAERATADLASLLPCDAAAGEACARQFVASFGRRAFRRPLADDEVEGFLGLYRVGAAGGEPGAGVRLVLEAILQSPPFLYRLELEGEAAAGAASVPLGPWQLASRLSYFLWGSMPDEELFAAAESGRLAGRDEVAAQARRMLGDPRARELVARFHEEWLDYDRVLSVGRGKSAQYFPEWSADYAPLMLEEARAFVGHVVFDDPAGDLATLLTASYSFANGRLAAFYGLEGGPAGEAFARVEGGGRGGLLSLGALLTFHAHSDQTSPVHRGQMVRERLLCDPVPPPPPEVDTTVPKVNSGTTARERFAAHSEVKSCASCHAQLDPVGFGFENFDGVGRYRAFEADGQPIDASGELAGTDVDGRFVGVAGLAAALARSGQVRDCYVTQWFRFAQGRADDKSADLCSIESLREAFNASGGNVRELLVAMTQTDAFLFRPAGGAP